MKKFHINNSHEVKACNATLMPCRFKEHYTDEKEAYKKAEQSLLQENEALQTIQTLSKLSQKTRIEGVLNSENFQTLDPITQRTVLAGINKVNPSLPVKEQEYWQTIYDQSPAGNIAVQRLKKTNPYEYAKKQKLAELHPFDEAPIDFSYTEEQLKNQPQSKIIMLSATWMSNMSPEEIDSVYWVTTHGAGILNKHMIGQEHPSAHNYSKEFLDKQAKSFSSAMNKAPVVDEPVILYRGTRERNLINGQLNSPASSSTDYSIAENFTKQKTNAVIMEIRTTKIPSVITMSAWGMKESEVLAPLGEYKIIGEKLSPEKTHIVRLDFIK